MIQQLVGLIRHDPDVMLWARVRRVSANAVRSSVDYSVEWQMADLLLQPLTVLHFKAQIEGSLGE